MDGLTEGRIVHFVMPDGKHRPAIVVHVWDKATGYVNLQVFTDGTNDGSQGAAGIMWRTSVLPSEGMVLGTWHWPERA